MSRIIMVYGIGFVDAISSEDKDNDPRLGAVKPESVVGIGIGIGLVNSIDPYIEKTTITAITAKQLIRIVKITVVVFRSGR